MNQLAKISPAAPTPNIPVRRLDNATDAPMSVTTINPDEWDAQLSGFRDVLHEQTAVFNRVNWSDDALQFLGVKANGQLLGGAVVRSVRSPLDLARLFIIRWGPVWRPENKRDDPENLRAVYRALVAELVHRQNGYLLVIPRSDPQYATVDGQLLRELGFHTVYQPKAPERYFVDVTQSEEAMLASFSQKWRYNLRKSQKQDLCFELLENETGYERFMALYRQMMNRKNFFETSPIGTLHDLVACDFETLRPVFGIVYHKDEAVAGAVIDRAGERSIYLYGATNDAGNRLRAGYFMQWEIASRLCAMPSVHWYDLGGGTSPDCSLHQFKRGMAGKTGVVSMVPPYFGLGANRGQSFFGKSAVKVHLANHKLRETSYELLGKFRQQ